MKPELCQQFDEYLLGLLSDAEHDAFILHLAGCSNCQELESQTRTIEESIRSCNAQLFPSPAWQEQIEVTLGESTKRLEKVDKRLIETLKTQRDWRITVAVAASVLAASILLLLRFANNIVSKVPTDNTTELVQNQIEPSKPNSRLEMPLMSVRAAHGFLCARMECNDPDIEFYVVLPSAN